MYMHVCVYKARGGVDLGSPQNMYATNIQGKADFNNWDLFIHNYNNSYIINFVYLL